MKRIIAMMMIITAISVYLFAAVALEFNPVKRYEEIKVTDITVTLKVPVEKNGAIKPVVPDNLRELRKSETITYANGNTAWALYAIVVMIIPAEHAEEFAKRVAKHANVEVLQRADLIASRDEFAEGEAKLDLMENRIVTALTPMAVLDR